jgi:pimeloyl-ACP methyl ester carboxylesterase
MVAVSARIRALLGEMQEGTVDTDDGVALHYQSFGSGEAVVFANGIGVHFSGAARQVAVLRERYRVICWDYRGVGQSRMYDAGGDISMPRHAADLLLVLDRLAVDRAVLVGWSMGVQVALEAARCAADRVAGLVSLLGTYGLPFRTAFPALAIHAEAFFGLLHRLPAIAQGMLDLAVAMPEAAFTALSSAMFVGPTADREVFAANVRSVAACDRRIYLRTLLALADHDASDVLPTLACPALVIAGQRDYLTPPLVAKHMAEVIPHATYREVEGGSHFALIEQPQLVNDWLLSFADQVYLREGGSS